jgi:hypothetical protein
MDGFLLLAVHVALLSRKYLVRTGMAKNIKGDGTAPDHYGKYQACRIE